MAKFFHLVGEFLACVISSAGIPPEYLLVKTEPKGPKDGLRTRNFGSDKLNPIFLALKLSP